MADLYRQRWNQELDFCSLKVALQMDVLRCKTPKLVRKEIWPHVLAYNLLRTVIAQSAVRHGFSPRTISFKAPMQMLEWRSHEEATALYEQVLNAIAVHRVADRPNRFEPRLRKRRFKKDDYMTKPRNKTKLENLKLLKKKYVTFGGPTSA